jgi:hypothetical protein
MYSDQISVNGKLQPATTQMWWTGISGMFYLPGTVAPARSPKAGTGLERAPE